LREKGNRIMIDANEKEIKMTKDKECVHSVRYAADEKDSPISTVYLSRKYAAAMPVKTTVIIKTRE